MLRDDDFREFVVNSTEISTHVRLNPNTKTAADTGLWTQEALPADALLYSAIVARAPRKGDGTVDDVCEWLTDANRISRRIQLGGDETTGSGVVALRWA